MQLLDLVNAFCMFFLVFLIQKPAIEIVNQPTKHLDYTSRLSQLFCRKNHKKRTRATILSIICTLHLHRKTPIRFKQDRSFIFLSVIVRSGGIVLVMFLQILSFYFHDFLSVLFSLVNRQSWPVDIFIFFPASQKSDKLICNCQRRYQ